MNRDRCYSGPDLRSGAPTKAYDLGTWRIWGRQRGETCPVCGGLVHAPDCSEAEYPISEPPSFDTGRE